MLAYFVLVTAEDCSLHDSATVLSKGPLTGWYVEGTTNFPNLQEFWQKKRKLLRTSIIICNFAANLKFTVCENTPRIYSIAIGSDP